MVVACLRSRFARWARAGLVTFVVVTLGATLALPATASPTKASSGAADVNFYNGKTLTIINGATVGNTIDLVARLYAKYMAKYLHATVNVENVPGSGNVIGSNRGYAARPDGLTMTVLNAGAFVTDVIEGYPGLHFSMTNGWKYVGGVKVANENVVLAHPDSSLTFDALMAKGAKDFKVLDVRSGTIDATNRLLYGAFGIPVQFVTAFSDQGTLTQAFEAGQGDLAYGPWAGLGGQAIRGGKAKAILSVNVGTSDRIPGVPNYTTEITKYKSRISKAGLAALNALPDFLDLGPGVAGVPPGTPANRVAALTKALHWSIDQPGFRQQATKEQLTGVGWESVPQIKREIKAALSSKPLAKYLGKYSS